MSNWRTQLAVAILALSCSTASGQSLGDVARSERERRARMAHHAPMLTDEDLRRDQILKQTPAGSDSALPSPDTTSTEIDENLPLGDYARALRQRRLAQPAPAENAVAAGPAPEPQPAPVAIVSHEPQPAATPEKTTSLGDLAREVRAERAAARQARIQEQKKAAQLKAPQQAAQPVAVQKPVQAAAKHAVRAEKTVQVAKTAPRAAHVAKASSKPGHSIEVAAKAKTTPAPQPAQPKLTVKAAQPAVQASRPSVQVAKARRAAKPAVQTVHSTPAASVTIKPAQLTTVAAKASTNPARQAPPVPEADITAGERSIRVPRGASLWKLAHTYMGAGNLWKALWKANPQIKDPNRIRAGQTLRLPELDNEDNASSNGL